MPEVVRVGKYVVIIYPDDHAPAHVHVKFARCQVRVLITEAGAQLGRISGEPKSQEIRRAVEIVADNLTGCLAIWTDLHGKN